MSVETLGQVGLPVAIALGKIGLAVAVLGFFGATFGAACETGLAAGYTLAQYFGWQWGTDTLRGEPGVVGFAEVSEIGSEVKLRESREGSSTTARTTTPGSVTAWASCSPCVSTCRGRRASGHTPAVLDARIGPRPSGGGSPVVALIIGRGRPGSLMGYERSEERGPWLVAQAMRWLHRRARLVRLGADVELDWTEGVVRIGPDADVRPFGSGESQAG